MEVETPRDRHTTKVVYAAGPQCPFRPLTMEAPNTTASKGPCTHRQRDDTKAHQRLKHSAMERHHHHHRRLTSHLHREGYQICLLNDQKSAYSKEERDSTTTKPTAMMTTSLRIQQPPTQGWRTKGETTPQI
jgi:hypothetical protein